MSYILDALKKIEHEKNKKRPDGRINITGDLFQDRAQPASKAVAWKSVLLIAVASLVACAGTWFLLQGNGREKIRPAVPPSTAPVNAPVALPVQVQSSPVSVTSPVSSTPVAVAPQSSETDGEGDPSARGDRRSKKQITVQSPSQKQPVQTVQPPADIKLSGIAWQDERSVRRAVINGFLLKEGAVVAGAKITDIQPDRVRFSSAGGSFEIKLDSVLPTGEQR